MGGSVARVARCRFCGEMFKCSAKGHVPDHCSKCYRRWRTEKARETRAAGFCPQHPDRPTNGKCACAECLARQAKNNDIKRKAAAARGECPYHPGRPVAPNRKRCSECLTKMVASAKRTKYGLGVGEWDAIFASQNRRCALCGTDSPARGWHTDHDHATGVVRGILCLNCNLMLGYAKDDSALLARAISYLNLHAEKGRNHG